MRYFFLLFLVLVSCAALPPQGTQVVPPVGVGNKISCDVDADCICGGIDKTTGDCFVGNRQYARSFVDMTKDCPDFCTGIAGHLETKCLSNVCKNVPREGWNQPPVVQTVNVTKEFNPANAHWLCGNGSWKEKPEDCFDNKCINQDDCQFMQLKGNCQPFMVAAPKSAHKLPVFYANKCGSDTEACSLVDATCPKGPVPLVKNVQCDLGKCALVTAETKVKEAECTTADDCVPTSCCHATGCMKGPVTKPCNMMCTQECTPGTLDCGGTCGCVQGKCVANYAKLD